MPVAIITGASSGLGLATARALAERGWSVAADARGAARLRTALAGTLAGAPAGRIVVVPGDVADPAHRAELAAAARALGPVTLLMNNASQLGPSPQPALADYPADELAAVYAVNVLAPVALTRLVIADLLSAGGTVVNVSSDAAVEAYAGWGGYGSSKAALDQVSAVLGAEQPSLRVYAFDPGDMRTELHQQAFPGEDISDRPEPATVVPALLRLLDQRPPSGRYRAADLLVAEHLATDLQTTVPR
ncbi:MAG: SDR family NAD(P)-dependent oxidoreductase [Streptosporangiaceae bacterium]|jgi:NAD(P)-dependent dehydrogenase (short-subunit alcohol dehydrogenase family)